MTGGRQIPQSLRGSIIKLGKMKGAALVKPQRRDWRTALGRRQNGSAEGLERGRSPDELYDEQKKIKMSTNTITIITNLDNNDEFEDDGACERCGCLWCEDDDEFENHLLFGSNEDGKSICRRCVRKENEDEDEDYEVPVFPAVRRMLDIPEHHFTACDCDGKKVWWFHRYEDRWYPSKAECGDDGVECDACEENNTNNDDDDEEFGICKYCDDEELPKEYENCMYCARDNKK